MRYQIEIENQPRQIHEGTAESAIAVVGRNFYIGQNTKQNLVQRLEFSGFTAYSYGFNSAEIRALP
jgi:hypothetical protein